jgi:nicotinamidase-related amidase
MAIPATDRIFQSRE